MGLWIALLVAPVAAQTGARGPVASPAPGAKSSPVAPPAAAGVVAPAAPPSAAAVVPLPALRVVHQQGEVLIDKGGNGASSTEPLRPGVKLENRDEISTPNGEVTLHTASGYNLRLGPGSLLVLLPPSSVFLAKGDLDIGVDRSVTPPAGGRLPTWLVTTACGRTTVRTRATHLHQDGASTGVSVFDGAASVAGGPPQGVQVTAGQRAVCIKGQRLPPPRSLLRAPLWVGDEDVAFSGAVVSGGRPAPAQVALRWQAVDPAPRHRLELAQPTAEGEIPLASRDVATAGVTWITAVADLPASAAGTYLARVVPIDDVGAPGLSSAPHTLQLLGVAGLGPDGIVRGESGVMPRISVPRGMTYAVLIDGQSPSLERLTPGQHTLQLQWSGRSFAWPLVLRDSSAASPAAPPPPADYSGDSTTVWVGQSVR